MRVAFLAPAWASCLDGCTRALSRRGHELLISYGGSMENTAYGDMKISEYAVEYRWDLEPDQQELDDHLRKFNADVVVMVSWHNNAYRKAIRAAHKNNPHALRVLFMDNVWRATPKQYLGWATRDLYVQPLFDAALVPGDRTEFFARRLGFPPESIIRGAYVGDTNVFGGPARPGEDLVDAGRFVAALRLVSHKGADILAKAYEEYRTLVSEPWQLAVAGLGPMSALFEDLSGVELVGFLEQSDLADLMRSSSAYINPSRAEPYGIVLHEAAAAGLPLITTDRVGAGPTMIQDGYNGWIVPSGNSSALAAAMARVSALSAEHLGDMSTISRNLASRLTPEGWARNLEDEFNRRLVLMRS